MEPPAVTYIIASTMRTGSYLLCEGLEYSAVAGHPREVFCPERRSNYAGEWRLPSRIGFDEFLRVAMEKSRTPNGVVGMKIHGHHVEPLAHECGMTEKPWLVLRDLFPTARYIHLKRRNRRAQAISWYRAEVTNEWWRITGVQDWDLTGKQPEFDGAKIHRRELELERQQNAWDEFFTAEPVDVLEMEYETLAEDYRGEVARALEFIGQDPALAKGLPEPRMVRQGDELTEEWVRWMEEEFPREAIGGG